MTNPSRYADVKKEDRKIDHTTRSEIFKLAQNLEGARQLVQQAGEKWEEPDWVEIERLLLMVKTRALVLKNRDKGVSGG